MKLDAGMPPAPPPPPRRKAPSVPSSTKEKEEPENDGDQVRAHDDADWGFEDVSAPPGKYLKMLGDSGRGDKEVDEPEPDDSAKSQVEDVPSSDSEDERQQCNEILQNMDEMIAAETRREQIRANAGENKPSRTRIELLLRIKRLMQMHVTGYLGSRRGHD